MRRVERFTHAWYVPVVNECKERMYVDALTTCPQKFLAVKSTPMLIYQNHSRIKCVGQIQVR